MYRLLLTQSIYYVYPRFNPAKNIVNSQSNIQIAVEVDVTVGNEQKLVWEQGKNRQKRLRNCPKWESQA